jgi:rubrerythrin
MNAVELARKMETDAIVFYREAAEKTSHVVGKRMFNSIMEDEKRHLRLLDSILEGMDIDVDELNPMDNIMSVFEEMRDEMSGKVQATADETDVLKIAMEMEKNGYELYRKSAIDASGSKEKNLFKALASEEEKHYEIFSNTLSFLNDSGNWFMWEERGIVEG